LRLAWSVAEACRVAVGAGSVGGFAPPRRAAAGARDRRISDFDRLERPTRENSGLHEELEALVIVLPALQRPRAAAAIERLILLDQLVRAFAAGRQRGGE
jgi:hypothetical protein